MTTVSSNPVRFTIAGASAPGPSSSSGTQLQPRKLFAGTHYYYGSRADEPSPAILAYSGCAFDPSSGRILLFGGGHHDYSGNEVWEFAVDRPQDRWTRHYLPSSYADKTAVLADIDNAGRPGMYVSTNRPISRHTYHSLTWAANVNRMFAGGGSTWDGPDGTYWSIYPNAPGDLWGYDPATRRWDYRGSSLVDRNRPVPAAMVYDPKRGVILTLSNRRTASYDPGSVKYSYTTVPTTVCEYDPVAGRWMDHGTALQGNWVYSLMAVDSARDCLVVLAWDSAHALYVFDYDLARREWVARQTKGDAPPKPFGQYVREGDRIVHSTRSGRILYVSATNDGALYGLDTQSWTWAQLLPFGAFPQIAQAFATCWCPLRDEMYVTYKLGKAQAIDVVGVRA